MGSGRGDCGYTVPEDTRKDPTLSQDTTEDVKERLVREMADAPQGVNDSDMPLPGSPNPTGQVGPSPTADSIPAGDQILGGGFNPDETGEEVDPGIANTGGVDAANTDGSTRTGA